ncbi:MAG: hypothetical protein JWO03_3167 [Bacteroidetes bacterium]|nr:hypothetical protein [Bacteroidota bacterium]
MEPFHVFDVLGKYNRCMYDDKINIFPSVLLNEVHF